MNQILKNVHETAARLHAAGHIETITMRDFDELCLTPPPSLSPDEIRQIRDGLQLSQAVFARYLNVKTITVAAWEQGTKKPGGPAMKLLDLVHRKGLDCLR